jgi:alkylation response protein AidB-like acyl-CoA dehydrogenase
VSDPQGGSFLLAGSPAAGVFTPTDLSLEHRMIRDLARRFVENEVLPQVDAIERQDWAVTTGLLRRAAECGLLGIEIPEQYGGANLDKVSAIVVAEEMARVMSFAVTFGGQTGIGALPFVYFASEALRERHLPDLVSGKRVAAYALSEAGSGSDALAAKTSARRSADGAQWILNGEKMWITNAAFADLFITFAQVDGDRFTCFAVERTAPGVSTGAEERKMGLKGSSTRPLILDNARIPIDSVIGEIGKGHHVAFNALNVGRVKLAAGAVGLAKTALRDSVEYARQRTAFGKPIARFGAIQHKLAEMAARIWTAEGMVYRTAGAFDRALASGNGGEKAQALRAVEEYAAECSLLKVFASEVLDFVVDEAVQIHGGYGYSAEYAVERHYRDSRVNRIFEGTNEINRLAAMGMLLKRAASGRLPLHEAAARATEDVRSGRTPSGAVDRARNAFLFTLGVAVGKHGAQLADEQEIVMLLADAAIAIYAADTAAARIAKSGAPSDYESDLFRVALEGALHTVEGATRQTLAAIFEGAPLRENMAALTRALGWIPSDTVHPRRRIAASLTAEGTAVN